MNIIFVLFLLAAVLLLVIGIYCLVVTHNLIRIILEFGFGWVLATIEWETMKERLNF